MVVVVVVVVVVVFLYLVRERESDKKGEKWINTTNKRFSSLHSTKNARARVVLETRDI
jgi:hypothetical protein